LAFSLCPHSSAFLSEQTFFCYQQELVSLGMAGQELAWVVSLFLEQATSCFVLLIPGLE
jgi:hypothetical protein